MRLHWLFPLALLSACSGNPIWTQSHGASTNISYSSAGPQTLTGAGTPIATGSIASGAPIEMPDHRVLVPIVAPPTVDTTHASGALLTINPADGSVATFAQLNGQPSTPVVDPDGNVYVLTHAYTETAQCKPASGSGTVVPLADLLIKFDKTGARLWDKPVILPCGTLPSLKLVESAEGHPSLFFWGAVKGVGPIVASDEDGNLEPISYGICVNEGGAKTYDAPLPWPDDPGFAVGKGGDGNLYLVQAANKCGLFFYRLSLRPANNASWPPNLLYATPIGGPSSGNTIGTPAIAESSDTTIAKIGTRLEAFHTSTGKQIKNWSIDTKNASQAPPTIALNSVLYFDGGGHLVMHTIDPFVGGQSAQERSRTIRRPR